MSSIFNGRSLALACVAASLTLVAACQSGRPAAPAASSAALPTMERVALGASGCWFKSGDAAFKAYRLAPRTQLLLRTPAHPDCPAQITGIAPASRGRGRGSTRPPAGLRPVDERARRDAHRRGCAPLGCRRQRLQLIRPSSATPPSAWRRSHCPHSRVSHRGEGGNIFAGHPTARRGRPTHAAPPFRSRLYRRADACSVRREPNGCASWTRARNRAARAATTHFPRHLANQCRSAPVAADLAPKAELHQLHPLSSPLPALHLLP